MSKKKNVQLLTPIGTLVWPYLLVPDSYKGKARYKANIRLPEAESTDMVEAIQKALKAAKTKAVALNDGDPIHWVDEYLPYEKCTGKNEGQIMFKSAINAQGRNKGGETFTNKVAVFDANGLAITDKTMEIYTGTQARIKVEVYGWTMEGKDEDYEGDDVQLKVGVSLRLKAAQIITLGEREEPDADSFGFDAVEGGFDVTAPAPMQDADGETVTGQREEY